MSLTKSLAEEVSYQLRPPPFRPPTNHGQPFALKSIKEKRTDPAFPDLI